MAPHYYGLNALQAMFGDRGFSVIGFPCNQFNLQEPGDNGIEILNGVKYVRPGGGFVPNFQMFKKIEVNGANEEPLYTYLKKYCPRTQTVFEPLLFYSPLRVNDVTWNYETFLINRQGVIKKRYNPSVEPLDLKDDIEKMLESTDVHNRFENLMEHSEEYNSISTF